MNTFSSALAYAGLIAVLAGFASVVKPCKSVGSRKRGFGNLGVVLLAVLVVCSLRAEGARCLRAAA